MRCKWVMKKMHSMLDMWKLKSLSCIFYSFVSEVCVGQFWNSYSTNQNYLNYKTKLLKLLRITLWKQTADCRRHENFYCLFNNTVIYTKTLKVTCSLSFRMTKSLSGFYAHIRYLHDNTKVWNKEKQNLRLPLSFPKANYSIKNNWELSINKGGKVSNWK